MNHPTRGTVEGRVYLDLQNKARREGRPNAELQQLYVLEGFLARLAASPDRDRFVLKGGVLLAAFGTRRPTRDVDFQGLRLANDTATVKALLIEVAGIPWRTGSSSTPGRHTLTRSATRTSTAASGSRWRRPSPARNSPSTLM